VSFTVEEAVDAILGHFTDAWNSQTNPPTLYYDDFGQEIPGSDTAWARIQIRHNEGGHAALGPPGQQKFERVGVVTVQVFTPLGDGRLAADRLMQAALRAFEGKTVRRGSSEVWFRRVRANEMGRNEAWYQINVIAEFEYDYREGS